MKENFMPTLTLDDLTPDDIQRLEARRRFRQHAQEVLREQAEEMRLQRELERRMENDSDE
jgi:hypothetical protein